MMPPPSLPPYIDGAWILIQAHVVARLMEALGIVVRFYHDEKEKERQEKNKPRVSY